MGNTFLPETTVALCVIVVYSCVIYIRHIFFFNIILLFTLYHYLYKLYVGMYEFVIVCFAMLS